MARRVVVLVINPTAGRGRAIRVGHRARLALRAAGHEIVVVVGTDAQQTKEKLRTALRTHTACLTVAVGGDGLVNLAASEVIGTDAPLAIIPAGTGNDIARGLGVLRGARRSIAELCVALDEEELGIEQVDVGEINVGETAVGEAAGGEISSAPDFPRYFLSVVTCGLDAAVNARANALRFPFGKARYLVALLAQLRHYRAYSYRLGHGGRSSHNALTDVTGSKAAQPSDINGDRELILVSLANLPFFGGGMRIAPGAAPKSGTLQAIFVNKVPLWQLIWVFPRIFWGGHVTHPAVEVVEFEELTCGPGAGNSPPMPFADGEPVTTAPLRIRVRPGALQLVKLG